MNTIEDISYRRCLGCGWVCEGIMPSNSKDDLKYSHCTNCFEDYLNFEEASMEDIIKHKAKYREFGKILLP